MREKPDLYVAEKTMFSLVTLRLRQTHCVHMVLFLPATGGHSYIAFAASFSSLTHCFPDFFSKGETSPGTPVSSCFCT